MTVSTEGVKARGRRQAGARAALLLVWFLLIFAQLGLFFAVHEETGRLFKSQLPRKARFLETNLFHAPSSSSPAQVVDIEDNPTTVYGDDKRIIHTGPNPLHN